jgi:hypothetical protein
LGGARLVERLGQERIRFHTDHVAIVLLPDRSREVSLIHPKIDDATAILEPGLDESMTFNTIQRHWHADLAVQIPEKQIRTNWFSIAFTST